MKKQINSLTSTRAIAALMVVIHHFGFTSSPQSTTLGKEMIAPFSLLPELFHAGNIAISYFFVLSGFVLYFSYSDTEIVYADYLKRRFGRIGPVYWLALLLFLVVAVCFYQYSVSSNLIKQILYCSFFLQAWFPQYALALNSPAWTISVEMLFYVLFPAFLLFQKKNIKLFITVTMLLFIISQYIHLHWYHPGIELQTESEGPAFYNPLIHLSQFLVGMTGAYIYNRVHFRSRNFTILSLVLLTLIILLIVYRPASISYHTGLLDPLFMLLILTVAISDPRLLNLSPLVFLGEVSYGIYILQWPVFQFFQALNVRYFHLLQPYVFLVSLLLLLTTASVSYIYIEKPLRKKINAINLRRKTSLS